MLARMSAQHRVLLVEDDAALARGLVEGLRRDNYDVTHHISGEAAIAAARSQPPQVVILDVRLPDISGFDVCRRMRQLGLRMPILILTAQGDDTDKVLGLELGADDYVTKPCSLRELSSRSCGGRMASSPLTAQACSMPATSRSTWPAHKPRAVGASSICHQPNFGCGHFSPATLASRCPAHSWSTMCGVSLPIPTATAL
jgi:CheY-like chemotaxis protein